jgi:hypothetical protein
MVCRNKAKYFWTIIRYGQLINCYICFWKNIALLNRWVVFTHNRFDMLCSLKYNLKLQISKVRFHNHNWPHKTLSSLLSDVVIQKLNKYCPLPWVNWPPHSYHVRELLTNTEDEVFTLIWWLNVHNTYKRGGWNHWLLVHVAIKLKCISIFGIFDSWFSIKDLELLKWT